MAAEIRANGKVYDVYRDGVPVTDPEELARATSVVRARSVSRPRTAIPPPPIAGPPFKRLIVCADGTWLNADNGLINGQLAIPSNVTRISRAIKDVSADGIPQIVYYHFGVGSRGGVVERLLQGTTGEGLDENVREAYSFIANNYTTGDEIFLIGFSRGAFTVRSIAGFMDVIGILTKKGLSGLAEIHQDVKNRRDPDYRPKYPDVPFPKKPSAADPTYARELERRGLTTLGVRIKAIAVWDTVGSLGLPRVGWLTKVGLQSQQSKETSFHDTKLGNNVDNAFQALALDERRSAFAPAIWEKPAGNKTKLRQVWFPGVHSNIGGGEDDQQLANITLAWMMSQLEPFLDMRSAYVLEQDDANDRYYASRDEDVRPWSFGKIPNSMAGLYALGGGKTRTPGSYHAADPTTNRPTDRLLTDTCEYIHPSVRARLHFRGPGVADKSTYTCPALADWSLHINYDDAAGPDPDIFYRLPRPLAEKGQNRDLPESPLFRLERDLARRDPESFGYVLKPAPTGAAKPKRSRRGGEGRASSRRTSVGPSAAGAGSRRARSVDGGRPEGRHHPPPPPRAVSRRRGSMDTWEIDDEDIVFSDRERDRERERERERFRERDHRDSRGGFPRPPPEFRRSVPAVSPPTAPVPPPPPSVGGRSSRRRFSQV
ncbi:hypothetical protein EJ05DRAFT_248065 [Pseudovirgaria hyperparasitica]|uniref:T6SS Phospholipase effector Tle1-like catalytic domain-containing protein n=1 Tax=Pseudovirgaria hyperparasitica TaxID=470096 RepID=A0A6A6WH42_9PEZI|nr:uncharacterized protein EJ05DRAFT_248065 [Pseudovirgaria hyperparasitica]KAF2760967.1 hypothetical protein EJ05DRAFT_248065 [Pseudovirgaria hyperparasitica]